MMFIEDAAEIIYYIFCVELTRIRHHHRSEYPKSGAENRPGKPHGLNALRSGAIIANRRPQEDDAIRYKAISGGLQEIPEPTSAKGNQLASAGTSSWPAPEGSRFPP
jgi:hypothetical protein